MDDVIKLPDHKLCPGGTCPSCGCDEGIVEPKGLQDVVRCKDCRKYIFNASRSITGKETRTLKTTHEAISTKQRFRIIERAGGRCETCGSRSLLTVGHVVSVADGHKAGLSDQIINSDENLICQCAECNSGTGEGTIPLRMYVLILNARNMAK